MVIPLAAILAFVIGVLAMTSAPVTADQLTPAEARAIAKEATIYGFPLVDNYRVQYSYFVGRGGDQYKAPWNTLVNNARVYTPADTAIQTPNSDTPYSFIGADLRAEPLVFSVPAIDKDRYYSLQFIDMYTFNFAYVGSRATGNDAGAYLAGRPGLAWRNAARHQGGDPIGDRIRLRHLPDPAFRPGRHRQRQENPGRIQGSSRCRNSSASRPPPAPPAIDFIKPLSPEAERSFARVFQHPQFRSPILPAEPGRDGDHGPVRQARDRPARDLRRESALARDAESGPGRHGRRVGGIEDVQGNGARHRQTHQR